MAPRNTPARTKALAFLRELIASGRETGTYRLPTVRELAALAGVGPMTMLRAVQQLSVAGELDARPKQGITIAGGRHEADPRSVLEGTARDAHLQTWERVYRQFQHDLIIGVYAPGTVCPTYKELAEHYGTSYHSLRKAVDHLVSSGALVRYKKGLQVPVLVRRRPGGTIVLLAHAASDGRLDVSFARAAEGLALFQSECYRRNVSLEVVPVRTQTGSGVAARMGGKGPGGLPSDRPDILGYAMYGSALPNRLLEDLCLRLAPADKPVAVFDDGSGLKVPSGLTTRLTIVRGTNTQTASHRVGRFLLHLGHRRVLYLSPTHGAAWSQERLQGLVAAFAEAGMPDAVTGITCERLQHTPDALPAGRTVHSLTEEAVSALRSAGGEPCEMFAHLLRRIEPRLFALMEEELLWPVERELFERALALPEATAWVASSDYVASRVVRFLREQGVAVPRDISVVGFDDSMEAFVHGITSYNFDMHSVVRGLLGHILNPPQGPPKRGKDRILDIEGFVTERETTAKAPSEQRPEIG
ncbi:MAG: GntR family transcriptional regulator [Chitinivibrionales bacterium]|nr:GntR family transcriptional regulator [Chitinivibrionales bacterium]